MYKKIITLVITLVISLTGLAQDEERLKVFSTNSEVMDQERTLKVYLPKNYSAEELYPVIYITDAGSPNFDVAKHYLDALSDPFFNVMPQCILVGIEHNNRNAELDVFDRESGKIFKEYLFNEVVPFINSNYSTSGFNAMIGHSDGAEYNHFLMLSEKNPFHGFASLSTNFNTDVRDRVSTFFKDYSGRKLYYFVANATADSPDRGQAGNEFETLYNEHSNPSVGFNKKTYTANHMTLVPHALPDALKFIFNDYNNLETYASLEDYTENYLFDLKRNYGLDGSFSYYDVENYLVKIILNKKVKEYEYFLDFVEEHKLWQGGGLDDINAANHYYLMEQYDKTIYHINKAANDQSIPNAKYFYNYLKKAESAYAKENRLPEFVEVLKKGRDNLPEKYTLYMNYKLASFSLKNQLSIEEGKKALAYCKDNYRENKVFSKEDLADLKRLI